MAIRIKRTFRSDCPLTFSYALATVANSLFVALWLNEAKQKDTDTICSCSGFRSSCRG